LSYTIQVDALERETLAFAGAFVAQGGVLEESPLVEARRSFDAWLLSDGDAAPPNDLMVMRRALGLKEARDGG
jgi:hypothetical protein